MRIESTPIRIPGEGHEGVNPEVTWIQEGVHMSMTAGEGDGGAGIMDDASCNSVVETATAAASVAAAASECDSVGSLVKRCAGDGD
jgi:hypothetical protein